MTPQQFIQSVQARIDALNANREDDVLRITFDLVAQVRLRVQTTGDDFTGNDFAPYTPGYAKQRAKAGYQVGYVDFTRTGRLWASVRPETIEKTETSTTVEVTARTTQDQLKLRGARKKRGNILLPSESEIAIAAELNRQRILKYLS